MKNYQEKHKQISDNDRVNLERFVMLRTIDMLWMEHLETMECLRDSVRLRAYGQRDPLVEYKNESRRLFGQMMDEINNSIVNILIGAEIQKNPAPQQRISEVKSTKNKVGRNDLCPCGSGKKYKKCCMNKK
jgi:preprotein translocase subunit SecA